MDDGWTILNKAEKNYFGFPLNIIKGPFVNTVDEISKTHFPMDKIFNKY